MKFVRIILLVGIGFPMIWHNECLPADSHFRTQTEPRIIASPQKQLGIGLFVPAIDVVFFDRRQPGIEAPGDYYRFPWGADTITITSAMKIEIVTALQAAIRPVFFDTLVVGSITGYRYRLRAEQLHREEYHVRYCQGDTVYVISGWTGKFLSFYRAVPGVIKYDLNELQQNISRFAAFDVQIPQEAYDKSSHENPYFVEYVNRDKMTRIRCYHVSEETGVDTTSNSLITIPRTLIEITKFIDKEVMP